MSSTKPIDRTFVSFRSSSSNLDADKKTGQYEEDQAAVRDDILAAIAPEAWFQVSARPVRKAEWPKLHTCIRNVRACEAL